MSVLNAIWVTGRLVGSLVFAALEIYVLYVYVADGWRVGAAWKVLRGKAGIVEANPQTMMASVRTCAKRSMKRNAGGRESN